MATKVTLLRPQEEGLARIELGFSRGDIELVSAFDPRALKVSEKDTKAELFEIGLAKDAKTLFGRSTLLIGNGNKDENIVVIVHDVKDNVNTNVALANIVKFGDVIEKQIKQATKAYATAKTSISVEGEEAPAKKNVKEGK